MTNQVQVRSTAETGCNGQIKLFKKVFFNVGRLISQLNKVKTTAHLKGFFISMQQPVSLQARVLHWDHVFMLYSRC
jgi:hypothetical protein